jgi:hypothetical protein
MFPSVPPSDIYIDKQGSGNLRTAVQLPEGEDLNEWIAVHGQLPHYLSQTELTVSRRFL